MNVIDDSQVLNIISSERLLEQCYNDRTKRFDPIPIKRILNAFLEHLSRIFENPIYEKNEGFQAKRNDVFEMFANVFKKMNPTKYPWFVFSWVSLISSPFFMPMMLGSSVKINIQERWFKMQELFNELFEFLKQNIYENCPINQALDQLFEGTLKLCLITLHDFPEFFCYYYFEFISHLPLYNIWNLRNLILAAYPKDMRLPDPNADISFLPESKSNFSKDRPYLLKDHVKTIDYEKYKADLDMYLETQNNSHLSIICEKLESSQIVYDHRRIIDTGIVHSTILYLAHDIQNYNTVAELENPDLCGKFIFMAKKMSTPLRDIFLNAMFDELRLLNKSTVFFMNVLLQIFRESGPDEDKIRSQMARILLERLTTPKIHPWGLLAFRNKINSEPNFKTITNQS